MRIGLFLIVLVLWLPMNSISAHAQSPGYMPNSIDRRLRPTPFQAVKEKWDRVSEDEIICIETALQQENTNIKTLMQRGIVPNDPVLAKVRADCQAQKASAIVDARAKQEIAELSQQLTGARAMIEQLQAEVDQLKSTSATAQSKSMKGGMSPAGREAQRKASYEAIKLIAEVVFGILFILFLIGLFVPKDFGREKSG